MKPLFVRRGLRALAACAVLVAGGHAHAAEVIDLAVGGAAVFHHLDASGRHGLAVSDPAVALVWEDNRDGSPRCHLALRADRQTGFRPFGYSFGDDIAQWHAALAGNARGELIVAWDDERDGRADLWFSRLDGAAFGEDFTLAATSGPEHQADPVLALDADGGLHVAWTQRDADGTGRLRYLYLPRRGRLGGVTPVSRPRRQTGGRHRRVDRHICRPAGGAGRAAFRCRAE